MGTGIQHIAPLFLLFSVPARQSISLMQAAISQTNIPIKHVYYFILRNPSSLHNLI